MHSTDKKKFCFTPKIVYAFGFGGGYNAREGRERTKSESLGNVERTEGET